MLQSTINETILNFNYFLLRNLLRKKINEKSFILNIFPLKTKNKFQCLDNYRNLFKSLLKFLKLKKTNYSENNIDKFN